MPWQLNEAVGLTDEGTQCPNRAFDQQQVAELLDAVGIPTGGISLTDLPPIGEGFATPELCEAIRNFQTVQGLTADARVDVDGATWQRLIELVQPAATEPGGVPLLLNAADFEVLELPQSAADLPSLTYALRKGIPGAKLDVGSVRLELFVIGPIKIGWSKAFPLACQVSPNFANLERAVASGSAREIGGVALDQLCASIKLESRDALGSLFSAISIKTDITGNPIIGGSIGDDQLFTSFELDLVTKTLVFKGVRRLMKSHPVTGGEVQITGDVGIELKVTSRDLVGPVDQDEASVTTAIIAALVAAAAAGVLLAPAAIWLSTAAEGAGLAAGMEQTFVRVGAAALP